MNVSELMTRNVKSCSVNDTLQRAAQIMWENDCGIVPILDGDGRMTGVVTDRDICMAAYTQGKPLWQLPVSVAMAQKVHSIRETEALETAEALMRSARVRRVPVLDGDGRVTGMLSLNDLARHSHRSIGQKSNGLSGDSIAKTLAAICERSPTVNPKAPAATSPARVSA